MKLGLLMCSLFLMISNVAVASPLLSGLPEVKVPETSPAKKLVCMEDGFGAQMYWSREPHIRSLDNVFMSAVIKDTALNVDDDDNLIYSLSDAIDKGLRVISIQKTPYSHLKRSSNSLGDLSYEIQKYDAGMLFFVDNQKDGEVGLHVFLKDTLDGKVFGHYTARIAYDEKLGFEDKKSALVRGIAEFAREFDKFRNGKRDVSEIIYDVR